MNLIIRNLVTATTVPEKLSIANILYTVLPVLFYFAIVAALIAVLQSIPSFREQSTPFKFIIFVLVIRFTPVAILVIPIAKITSKVKARKKPKVSTQPHAKLTADDIVYCNECGASYIKGQEPDICTECGEKLK